MKEAFERMNEQIQPAPELEAQVMEQAVNTKRGMRFRPAIAAAAVLALILVATPVLADRLPSILERVAPEKVEELDPVGLSDTDNGITMEIVAASIHEDVAEMVVRLQGEALSEPIGVAPVLDVQNTGFTSISIHSLLDYEGAEADRAEGIYYYQVEMRYRDGTPIEEILGDQMTVTLSSVRVSGYRSGEGIEVPVIYTDYEQITVNRERAMQDYGFCSFGWGSSEGYEYYEDLRESVVMTPGESVYDVTDKLSLTGAAYIDGMLHIQMAASDLDGSDPDWYYSSPELVDEDGNVIVSAYRNLFAVSEGGNRIDYTECVYPVPQEAVENCRLVVRLGYREIITANCEVTFPFREYDSTEE